MSKRTHAGLGGLNRDGRQRRRLLQGLAAGLAGLLIAPRVAAWRPEDRLSDHEAAFYRSGPNA